MIVIIINGESEKMMKSGDGWRRQTMGARSGGMASHISQSVAQAAGPCRGQGSCQPFPESSSRNSGPACALLWGSVSLLCCTVSPPGSSLRWAPESGVLWHLHLVFLYTQWFWEYQGLRTTGLGINPSVPQTLPYAGL